MAGCLIRGRHRYSFDGLNDDEDDDGDYEDDDEDDDDSLWYSRALGKADAAVLTQHNLPKSICFHEKIIYMHSLKYMYMYW